MTIALFLIITFLGSVLQTVSGFGFGIFVQMFFPYFLPSAAFGTAVSGLMSPFNSLFGLISVRKKVQYRVVAPIIAMYMIVNVLIVLLTKDKPDDFFKKLLAVVMIVFGIYFLFFAKRIRIRPTLLASGICGALSGVIGGLFSMGGPPLVLYYSTATDDKEAYLANIRFTFLITTTFSTVVRIVGGIITRQMVGYSVLGLVTLIPGVLIGKRLVNRINIETLKRIIYIFMMVSGVYMLVR